MPSWTLCAFVALVSISVYAQLTPWDNQLFDFGWTPYNPTLYRCSNIPIGWNQRTTANPDMQAPFTIIALYGGYIPITIATVQPTAYNWTVTLPTGGPYILSMHDAQGYTGGDSLVFNVDDAISGTCGTEATTANTLQVSSSGSLAECSAITVTAQGGSAPYTMQIRAGQRPPKTTIWTTQNMSYTIDMQPSEQFFVMVTDANGLIAVDGIHTVTSGNTSCYGVATTVSVASLALTESYNPTNIPTFIQPQSSSSPTQDSSSGSLIVNTGTATVTDVVTLPGGSKSTLTLAPNATATINSIVPSPPSKNTNLSAIIGGAAGGAALLILILIIYFMYRRTAQKRRLREQEEEYERRRLSDGLPPAATQIQPFPHIPDPSPNRDSAPLMSNYSSGIPSVVTPAASGESYFNVVAGNAPWANPEPNYHQPNAYSPINVGTQYPTSPSMSITSVPTGVTEGIPPGAMPPRIGASAGMRQANVSLEKATFVPVRPSPAAPPPYSNS